MHPPSSQVESGQALGLFSSPVLDWFTAAFPRGPTVAQARAWPLVAAREHVLLISPTGSGKTLAAFLAILDRLFREHEAAPLAPGLRCVYVSPLRSLNYDIEHNLKSPLEEMRRRLDRQASPIQVAVRTGDTPAHERRKLRDRPPHVLITTPESLSLLLSQASWLAHWLRVEHIIVDEVHALVATKRGADLAVSLERLSAVADCDPQRIGLSATCRPHHVVSKFLVGPGRSCHVVEAVPDDRRAPLRVDVASLIEPGEATHRGLTYRRLLGRLAELLRRYRTTVVFANTRAFAEKITHDLRKDGFGQPELEPTVAAHHSALDMKLRRSTEAALRSGRLRAVVTSTSLELGVDIGTADMTVQVGLPGSAGRCVQRIGRSGHGPGRAARGLLLAATRAELAGAIVTAQAARSGRIEPLDMVTAPLDVVCQQLVGMACTGEQSVDATFELLRKTGSMSELTRADFQACLDYLAGRLRAPAGADEPAPGAELRWTAPRLWQRDGRFGLRSGRVARWFWTNVGTIHSEESVQVLEQGVALGTLEAAYAERLLPGDRFILDGRAVEAWRLEGPILHVRPTGSEARLPRWTSDRQTLSSDLARDLAEFRVEAAERLIDDGAMALGAWLKSAFGLDAQAGAVLVELFEAQVQQSEVPQLDEVLVEESPSVYGDGVIYAFHVPLHRSACEALGRATAARIGRRMKRNLSLSIADLGWAIRLPGDALPLAGVGPISSLLELERLVDDILEGLDRGQLLARRFRQVAATALMILDRAEPGRRVRVGGRHWASTRLYPLVKSACPDHPLIRETRREVLEDVLDAPAAAAWLQRRPTIRVRKLSGLSPFASAWIEPGADESLQFESAADALRRLHARLIVASAESAG
jgi:ATP-dependent Lhr-like helicase